MESYEIVRTVTFNWLANQMVTSEIKKWIPTCLKAFWIGYSHILGWKKGRELLCVLDFFSFEFFSRPFRLFPATGSPRMVFTLYSVRHLSWDQIYVTKGKCRYKYLKPNEGIIVILFWLPSEKFQMLQTIETTNVFYDFMKSPWYPVLLEEVTSLHETTSHRMWKWNSLFIIIRSIFQL